MPPDPAGAGKPPAPNSRQAPPAPAHPAAEALAITHIASAGDGAGQRGGVPAFVPFTLPGETVTARFGTGARGQLVAIAAPSPDRVAPPCPAFGRCGGCALQHWADAPYAAWKTDIVRRALARAGYPDAPLAPLRRTPPEARRRMEFAARRTAAGLDLGLHEAFSSHIVPLALCPVLHPALAALFPPLRAVLLQLTGLRRGADIAANLTDSGPDLLIRADSPATAQDRARLAAFAAAQGVARISWAVGSGPPETAALAAPPRLRFAGTEIEPPPGAFLQASAEGEDAIVAAVLAGLPPRLTGRARIVELFAGIGTLSFPLARHARVQAYEGDPAAAAALRRATTGTRVETHHRDLARQPLQPKDLAGAAAIVLDPPYAGAGPQMAPLAASRVPRIIMVSCNPMALAKDAALLKSAGYTLVAATPIDQFLWSAQIEAVAVFAA